MSADQPGDSEAAAAFDSVLAPLLERGGSGAPIPVVPDTPLPRLVDDYVAPEGAEAVLRVEGLSKSFGDQVALESLSFELFPGDIMGFLGPNGAGKTTTLRILATVLKADKGSAAVAGFKLTEYQQIRRHIGYLPDFIGSYDDLQVSEYMEFFARAYNVKADRRQAAITEALAMTELADLRSHLVGSLSRGKQQRLALARLLMHDPKLLLLDEPAAGLDPRARVQLRDILRALRRQGKAIILSSHVLEDLAEVSNKVAVLDRGRLLAFGTTSELLSRLRESRRWRLRMRQPEELDKLRLFLQQQPEVSSVAFAGSELYATFQGGDEVVEAVHHRLFEQGFRVLEFAEEALGLEELYLRITGAGES
jgi:ABC-2 type transport system ATP-binding protein